MLKRIHLFANIILVMHSLIVHLMIHFFLKSAQVFNKYL